MYNVLTCPLQGLHVWEPLGHPGRHSSKGDYGDRARVSGDRAPGQPDGASGAGGVTDQLHAEGVGNGDRHEHGPPPEAKKEVGGTLAKTTTDAPHLACSLSA